jgi:tripartite-type tricarboxylate transporter receptor subunit TctC
MVACSLRRHIVIAAATLVTSAAIAQSWPTRPVTMVVPFAAGSASDTVGRILAARLSEVLGQQVLVENIGGAGGMTGTARVANASPDGYQFVLGSVDTFAMNQSLYKKLPYRAATDFVPVGLVIEQPILLITRNELPAKTVPQFVSYAKANQGKMQYGSAGVGSGSHLTCARMNAAMGVDATHIPYRGSAQAMQDLLAGRIDYFCALGAAAMAPLEGGTAKAIAILSPERSPLFPNLASAHEQFRQLLLEWLFSAEGYVAGYHAAPASCHCKYAEHVGDAEQTEERRRHRRSDRSPGAGVSQEVPCW